MAARSAAAAEASTGNGPEHCQITPYYLTKPGDVPGETPCCAAPLSRVLSDI